MGIWRRERRGGLLSDAHLVIAAADHYTESGGRDGAHSNAPGSDLKRPNVALGWYRFRPSELCRSYTALAPKLDLPFVGLEGVEVQ